MTGSLPRELGSMSHLSKLDLEENEFSGNPFFNEIFSLKKLREYKLSNNAFTGSIPTRISDLPLLESLWLANNAITGTIPNEITDLANLGELIISLNLILRNKSKNMCHPTP